MSDGSPGSCDEVPALANVPTVAGDREATIMRSLHGALSPIISLFQEKTSARVCPAHVLPKSKTLFVLSRQLFNA